LDDIAAADDPPAQMLHQLLRARLRSPAGGEHVVMDELARPARDHLGMELELVPAVLERVARTDRLRRELARAARGNESAADLLRDRGTEDEPSSLRTEHQVGLLLRPPLREPLDRISERPGIRQQRGDVLEADALLRPVRDLTDLLGEIHRIMLTQAGAPRARTGSGSAAARAPPTLRDLRALRGAAPDCVRGARVRAPVR